MVLLSVLSVVALYSVLVHSATAATQTVNVTSIVTSHGSLVACFVVACLDFPVVDRSAASSAAGLLDAEAA